MRMSLLLLAAIGAAGDVNAQNRIIRFDEHEYRLAFVDVARDGTVTNEYVKDGDSLESWSTLLAVRRWPASSDARQVADAWIKTVLPLLSRKAQIYQREQTGGAGRDLIVEAWLAAPDKSYIEVNLHRFVGQPDRGVTAYQFAQRIPMTNGRGDPSPFLERRRALFKALGSLVAEPETRKP